MLQVLLLTVLIWVAGLWLGWTVIFAADPGSVVASQTRLPADLAEKLYFSGFTLFTLGIGDYVASGDGWRVVTAAASFLGLFLVTLAITYLISVVSAVVTRRSFATSVHLLGDDGTEVLLGAWTGSGMSTQTQAQLLSLATQAVGVAQQHFAYPALHLFVSDDEESSAPHAIRVLEETVWLLDEGLAEEARPGEAVRRPLRRALRQYLDAMPDRKDLSDPPPSDPDLGVLRDAGIPVVLDASFRDRIGT